MDNMGRVMNGEAPEKCSVSDFWKWAYSDLNDNLTRAALAEFIVASALGDRCVDQKRAGWRVYDLLTDYGCRIEVKASAYRQSWSQKKPSKILFGVGKQVDWENKENPDRVPKRHSDIYVFCVFNNLMGDEEPLDLSLWNFYVVATDDVDSAIGDQKTITLDSLKRRLPYTFARYTGLAEAIRATYERLSGTGGGKESSSP